MTGTLDEHRDFTGGEASPAAALHRLAVSFWLSQSLYVMAKLRVADQLSEGPRPVRNVATAVGADASALYRVMRALASVGVFTETAPREFALTAMGSYLQSGVTGSLRAQFLTINELDWLPWGHLLHSVRTGETAFEHHHGMGLFDYLERHPDVGKMFNEAMTGFVAENGLAAIRLQSICHGDRRRRRSWRTHDGDSSGRTTHKGRRVRSARRR